MGHGTRRERSLSGHRPAIGGRCVERIRGQALLAMRLNFRGRLFCRGPSIRVRPAPKRAPDALGRPLWISAKAVGNSRQCPCRKLKLKRICTRYDVRGVSVDSVALEVAVSTTTGTGNQSIL